MARDVRRDDLTLSEIDRINSRFTKGDTPITLDSFMKILIQNAMDTPEGKTPIIYLPVDLPFGTKKNKDRLIAEDKSCPLGNIQKLDFTQMFSDYAIAAFNTYELIRYLSILSEENNDGKY